MAKLGVKGEIPEYWIDTGMRYTHYQSRLKAIATSRIQYRNMPPEIDVRYLNEALYGEGYAVFYYDQYAERYVALRCMYGGELDIYNIPFFRTAYASNGYNYELDATNSVIIWNNYQREPDVPYISYFASRLANAESAIDVNMHVQKTPFIIAANEEEKLTLKNIEQQVDKGAYAIHTYKGMMLDQSIKVLDLKAPFVADKCQEIKTQIWNEALTYLGIPNTVVNKKERLITDEVQRQQGGVEASSAGHLEMQNECWEKVNRMFGLNIEAYMPCRENVGNGENVSRETLEEERIDIDE